MPPKRRRRFQGLYYHSSPPKVLPMNGQIANENGRKRRETDDLSVKLSTIRIWMHEKDIGKLTRILWAGQGQRLRQQASTNPKVKRFLAAVPYVMNSIKDVHQAVIDNSLETLQTKLEPPVPPALVTCRDANGLNLIHKAAGLGHATILEYLITTWPDGVHETDITGKTPLHWAASAKNNMRCYTLLTQAGCDEEAVDYKMKTPSFYRHKPHEIERAFLTYVPEAPRVSPDIPTDWEALSDDSGDGKKPDIKIPEMNGFGRHSNAESNENTSEAEMTEGISGLEDEDMSKDDDGGGDDSEAIIENGEAEEAATEEPEEHTEPEEEEETPAIIEDNEEEHEEEDTQDEQDKEEEEGGEEEPQDEKQQTETENDIANVTKDDTEPETENKEENAKEENNENVEHETESNGNETENKTEHELEDGKESETNESETKEDAEVHEENGGDEEDDEDSKKVSETLGIIKDELKDNVKYLANKVKNVFKQNEDEESDKDEKNNDEMEEDENKENRDESSTTKEENNENEEKEKVTEEEEENNETNENADKNKEEDSLPIENSQLDEVNNTEELTKTQIIQKTDTSVPDENDENLNEIKKEAQKLTNSIVNSLETSTQEFLKNENNNKTEEDENNNHTKEIETTETITKEPTDEDYEKINKSLEQYLEEKEKSCKETQQELEGAITEITGNLKENIKELDDITNNLEENIKEKQQELGDKLEDITDNIEENFKEKHQDLGDKLEEITDNIKENIKDVTGKVKNLFTSSSSDEKLENEATDVVVHTESPTKQLQKAKDESESSDETADEDEAAQVTIDEANNDDIANDTANDIAATDEEAKNDDDNDEANDAGDNNTENLENDDDREGDGSPTSSLAIEGFVQGEAEDNTVQSQTAAYVHDDEDTRIQNVIASGDMEQLAQIVLNGDGQKLLNIEATEPEIQAFLKNIPNYMIKIRRVHEASRGGSLLNLQQALDRRKFAIAKDEISPNGATPLHVAVLFGHSDIVRYLSARFPETLTISDINGRTALHYAAVINDNGHFYNVLLQLGANPKVVDKMGHTPEDYLGDDSLKDTLNYGQLLKSFGAEEMEAQLLSDQGQIENHSFQENPIFKTEQGKYLADNLADPLIRALTQVAQKRPNDPLEYLTNYLQTYVTSRNTNGKTTIQAAIHSGSSQTNSTALVNSKPSTPPPPKSMAQIMNGHVKYNNADEIEEDSVPQIDDYDDDDGNDSDAAVSKKLEERDEHGQSMLHFASARSHRKGGLIHLIEEAKADITYRDELYRTARDVALQANQLGNAKEIDRYLISLAVVGDVKPFEHFAISGYDHIIDVVDDNEMPIIDVAEDKGHLELVEYLRTVRPLEELREELHQMIRDEKVDRAMEVVNGPHGKWLIMAKNYYGRTALHIAILKESEELVDHFVRICPEVLKIGDNLERTPLHYAMGTNIIDSISRNLIQNGAKRTNKDLKGRQPSYYFMNKAEILRLQEEEDENR